ncbi:integrin alpha-3b isoform X1 [Brienomyrus brachyistius]|uniref:integrin alpha-3b isoform X1 n=1 Tax=Brienomyrus brachyistius TaxID=42636 RepID=UPI0020B4299A|nr:integrin alpha-3b isoform X1 [Brienomyrus brachyistius]
MASKEKCPLRTDFYLLLLGIFSCILTCFGFNLDVRFPVIKEGKTKGSFFGFSVALHNQTEGSKKYLLLTGAPKEKALPQLKVNETGAVYSCPITTETSDCTRMDLVSSATPTEMVEGMWLGVAIASQSAEAGGHVLACGHRYISLLKGASDQFRMIGKCYVRGNDLTFNPTDEWQSYSYEGCNPNFYMEEEGLCNMGISAGITKTDVFTGSPGSYFWQGNVHVTWRDPTPGNSWDYINRNMDKMGKHYSYIGYSVLEGQKVLSKNIYTVVTGAPRYEHKGSVFLVSSDNNKLTVKHVLHGEQVGSYFGNSIAVADLNNDDWNDLIVGAPFYFDRKKEEGGAVYVYMNENGSFQETASILLCGPVGSGFGMAVGAIGDINQDGFPDFAVGAPFYDTGRVYIWMGSKQLISQKPSQVIAGSDLTNGGFQTFGYSISGGMDMDGNSYPDVLVGSLDERVALLRARPVIHLNKTFTVNPSTINTTMCSPGEQPCVTAQVCFSYTLSTGSETFKRNITVKYTVMADWGRRSIRVRFLENKQDSYTGYLSMPATKCQVLKLSLVEHIRDKLAPVVFMLNVSLHEPVPSVHKSLQNLDAFPVFSDKQSLSEKAQINFQKACGTDDKCTSNLQLTATFADEHHQPYPRRGGVQVMQYNTTVKKVILMVNVSNKPSLGKLAEDAHQAMLNITVPSSLRYSAIRLTSQDIPPSDIECKFEETLLCDLGNPFVGGKMVSFLIIFETLITLYTREVESQLQLSTISEQSDLSPVPVTLKVEFTIQTTFFVSPPQAQTYFSGKVMGESAMKSTSDVGSPVEYSFSVAMQGEALGSMGTIEVEIAWPYEVANGKWLLYISEILIKATSESRCVPPGNIVNTLNLTVSERNMARQKREASTTAPVKIEPQAAISQQAHRLENIWLDCMHGTARCTTFSCPLYNMSTTAIVIVRARVWNSTMLEDYSKASRVTVKGRASLKLITNIPTLRMNSDALEFSLDIDPVLMEEHVYTAPLWVIILAVLAGVFLLGLIVLILWKCGFFKRASRRQMYEAKAQKAEMKIQPSETERLTDEC